MTCNRVHTGQFRLAWSSMMQTQNVVSGSGRTKSKRGSKRVARVRELEAFPRWWLGMMIEAAAKEKVALRNVPYSEAHSWQVKWQKMQAEIRKNYAKLPVALVNIASCVRWTVTDTAGVSPTKETWDDKEWLARPIWKLTGSAAQEVADPVEQEMIGRLGKDWGRKVEEVTK